MSILIRRGVLTPAALFWAAAASSGCAASLASAISLAVAVFCAAGGFVGKVSTPCDGNFRSAIRLWNTLPVSHCYTTCVQRMLRHNTNTIYSF